MRLPDRPLATAALAALCALASGCASWIQTADQALVRPPGAHFYEDPKPVTEVVGEQWLFAAMAENAYQDLVFDDALKARVVGDKKLSEDEFGKLKTAKRSRPNCMPMPLPAGWTSMAGFPSDRLLFESLRQGLHVQVLEHAGPPHRVVVAFRGTEFFDLHDWRANFRWFARFIPGFEDQYHLVGNLVATEVTANLLGRFKGRDAELAALQLYSTGHSLGGGLAQHFAYALPYENEAARLPRVARVYAFDPSPVTGWFSIPAAQREFNAARLPIDRIFEHGEVLAYVRMLLGYVVPTSDEAPAIAEIRYNFHASPNIVANHSMRKLAVGLARAAGRPQPPDCTD